jgi:hypothetical protein
VQQPLKPRESIRGTTAPELVGCSDAPQITNPEHQGLQLHCFNFVNALSIILRPERLRDYDFSRLLQKYITPRSKFSGEEKDDIGSDNGV